MGAFKILYNDIIDILEADEIIKTVDDFNDQYNNLEINNNIKYPCVFVEAEAVSWYRDNVSCYTLAQPPQSGRAIINLHIIQHTLQKHNKVSKNEFFDLCDHVTSLIHRLQANENDKGTYQTLMRVSERYNTPNKQLKICIISFETILNDSFPVAPYETLTGFTFTLQNDYN
jgi:hypothetical protein